MVKGHGEQYPQSTCSILQHSLPLEIKPPLETRCNRNGKRSQLAISTSQLQHPVATHLIAGEVQVLQQRVLLQSLPQALQRCITQTIITQLQHLQVSCAVWNGTMELLLQHCFVLDAMENISKHQYEAWQQP